ncbi:MAG TPA: hypothetical protein VN639_08450 [Azonexus sp.]|nr:hypothetical protein [Azonexus sp.]
MKKNNAWFPLLMLLGAMGAQAQSSPDPEQKQRLVEQKLKLVEMLVNSPAAQATSVGREAETPALFERSRGLIKQAREAISGQRFDEAAQVLDEALRNVSKANHRIAGEGGLAESVQKKQFQDFSEQIASYQLSLQDMGKDPRSGESARKVLARINALSNEGQQLSKAGRLGDANKKMAEAYKIAVEEIARLRAGQEVVMSLKFDSPLEEFVYEQKRYQSNEILVGMMISEGRAAGETRKLVDGFLNNAANLKEEAGRLSNHNDYKGAVTTMEKANGQLNRALQTMGVPVF